MTDKEYLVLLSTFVPFGPARIKLLLKYFGSAKKVWDASSDKLLKLGLGQERTEEFIVHRQSLDIKDYFEKLKKLKIDYLSISDKDYPENLKEIDDAPYVLYVRGKLKSADASAVAIVGSRKMTAYGREVAQ